MARAAWIRKLRYASFRGVRFRVDSHASNFGRRIVDHEFPFRDDPFTEDLGRKQRRFQLVGYILGDNYFAERNALISACEKDEPGNLVHPYLGRKLVECVDLTVSETKEDGGIVTFTMTFHETSRKPFPTGALSLLDELQDAADLLADVLSGDFSSFGISNAPQYVIDSAIDGITRASDVLSTVASASTGDPFKLASLALAIRNLKANAADLVRTPSNLFANLKNAFALLRDALTIDDLFPENRRRVAVRAPDRKKLATSQGLAKRRTYAPLCRFGDRIVAVSQPTVNRTRQEANNIAFTRLIRTLAVIDLARASAETEYSTREEAVAQREEILDLVEDLLVTAPSDPTFSALQAFQTLVTKSIPNPEGEISRLATVTPREPVPSLVLVYDLYGSPDLEEDLVLRNRIKNPGFLAPGVTLEVVGAG